MRQHSADRPTFSFPQLEELEGTDRDELSDDQEGRATPTAEGVPNHLDRDSDSDLLADGAEQPGDADRDVWTVVADDS
jgi:hypothetical protein